MRDKSSQGWAGSAVAPCEPPATRPGFSRTSRQRLWATPGAKATRGGRSIWSTGRVCRNLLQHDGRWMSTLTRTIPVIAAYWVMFTIFQTELPCVS